MSLQSGHAKYGLVDAKAGTIPTVAAMARIAISAYSLLVLILLAIRLNGYLCIFKKDLGNLTA